jgi:hypothetical protein
MNAANAPASVNDAEPVPDPDPSKNTVSPEPTPPGNTPVAASNPATQSADPFDAATSAAPADADADADVAAAPPGNSADRLADADPPANAASPPLFSTHACTNTPSDNDTSTRVNVPNPGSNPSTDTDPALSNDTVAVTESATVAADPTPDGTNNATERINAAANARRQTRCPFCVTRPITPLQPPLAVERSEKSNIPRPLRTGRNSTTAPHDFQDFSKRFAKAAIRLGE